MSDARLSPQGLRITVADVDDAGPQQFVHATGLMGQDIGRMVRVQHFGLSSVPPAGSEGHGLALGGGADRLFALGLEHPGLRPQNTPPGGTVLYDAFGDAISLVRPNLRIVHSADIQIVVGSTVVRVRPGRIDLGAMQAPNQVETTAGPSAIVWAV
jgi:phage gp45-like